MTYRRPKEFQSVSQEVDLMLYIWVCVCGPLCLTVPLLQWVYVLHLLRNMCLPAPLCYHAVHLKCVRVLSQLVFPPGHLCYVERQSRGWVATSAYLFRGLIKGPGCAHWFRFNDSLWSHSAITANIKKNIPQRLPEDAASDLFRFANI